MNKLFLLRILLLLFQRNFPSRHYPNNCPCATYSTGCQIALSMPDKPVKYIGSLDHCDATILHEDDGEQEPDQEHVLLVPHHSCLTSTIPQLFVNTNPK